MSHEGEESKDSRVLKISSSQNLVLKSFGQQKSLTWTGVNETVGGMQNLFFYRLPLLHVSNASHDLAMNHEIAFQLQNRSDICFLLISYHVLATFAQQDILHQAITKAKQASPQL